MKDCLLDVVEGTSWRRRTFNVLERSNGSTISSDNSKTGTKAGLYFKRSQICSMHLQEANKDVVFALCRAMCHPGRRSNRNKVDGQGTA